MFFSSEYPRARLFRFLGQLPRLRDVHALRSCLAWVQVRARARNRATMTSFIQALAEKNACAVASDSKLDGPEATPLSLRLIRQEIDRAERKLAEFAADEQIRRPCPFPAMKTVMETFVSGMRDCVLLMEAGGMSAWEAVHGDEVQEQGLLVAEGVGDIPTPAAVVALREELDARLARLAPPQYAKHVLSACGYDSGTARDAIPVAALTQIGQHALNRVMVDGRTVAVVGESPPESPKAIAAHLRILVSERSAPLVVLDPEPLMDCGAPAACYFMPRAGGAPVDYDGVSVRSRDLGVERLEGGLRLRSYWMKIDVPGQEKTYSLPVLHIPGWTKDFERDAGAEGILWLEVLVNRVKAILPDELAGSLPMILSHRGCNRPGTLAAALALSDPNSRASLERIIGDERLTRNERMVADAGHRERLIELACRHGKRVLESPGGRSLLRPLEPCCDAREAS